MNIDYRIYSKNIYGLISTVFWLLASFLFAIDIVHFLKLFSHLKKYKIAAAGDPYYLNLQPTLNMVLLITIVFAVGSLLFFGNLAYLSFGKPKKYYTFVLPIISLILLLAVVLPIVPNTIDMIFQIPEPLLTDTILAEMPVDIYLFINKNLPYSYIVYWLQVASSVIALLFQYLGIKKLEVNKNE